MGIYSNRYVGQPSDYGYDETLDSIMLDESVQPCKSDDLIIESYNIIYTMEENYNILFTTLGINELQSLEEEERKFVYTENVLIIVWNKLKEFIKKIWNKIKGFFKKFILLVDEVAKSDKEFINKYRKEIFTYKNLDNFEFKGYKWNIEDRTLKELIEKSGKMSGFEERKDEANYRNTWGDEEELKRKSENLDEELDIERAQIINEISKQKKSKLTLTEFREEVRNLLRGGSTTKEELDKSDINIHKMVEFLTNSTIIKKKTNNLMKELKKNIEVVEKEIDVETKEAEEMAKDTTPGRNYQASWKPGKITATSNYYSKFAKTFGKEKAQKYLLNVDRNLESKKNAVLSWMLDNVQQFIEGVGIKLSDCIAVLPIAKALDKIAKDSNKIGNTDSEMDKYLKDEIETEPDEELRKKMKIVFGKYRTMIKNKILSGWNDPEIQLTEFPVVRNDEIETTKFGANSTRLTVEGWDRFEKEVPKVSFASCEILRDFFIGGGNSEKFAKYFSALQKGNATKSNLQGAFPDFVNYTDQYNRTAAGRASKGEWARMKVLRMRIMPRYLRSNINNTTVAGTESLIAIKECSRQYKACLVKYITYKPKKEDSEFLTEQSDLIYDEEKQSIYKNNFVYNNSLISDVRIL